MPPDGPEAEARLAGLKVAVTGHRGFIGRFLVVALRSSGISVTCVEGDVCSPGSWTGEFDLLFHLAAAMPQRFREDPGTGFSVNVEGTLRALEACRARKARMVLASTCGVYSPTVSGAISEDSPVDPRTPYAQSKLMAEMLCRSYAEHLGVACTVLRLFNIYGEGQKEEFLIPYLLRCAVEGSEAVVYHPESKRDFVHVTDAAQALILAGLSESRFGVFNIGSGHPYSVLQVMEIISHILNRPMAWRPGQTSKDPQSAVYAQTDHTSKELGWHSAIGLENGLRVAILSMNASGSEKVMNREE